MAKLAKLSWNVYAKAPLPTSEHVFRYLGRYTHRVGIANSRLLDVTDTRVVFRTRDDATETLTPVEFLWRSARYGLPDGFHKIRHIGLYASPGSIRRASGSGCHRPRPLGRALRGNSNQGTGTPADSPGKTERKRVAGRGLSRGRTLGCRRACGLAIERRDWHGGPAALRDSSGVWKTLSLRGSSTKATV